MENDRAKPSFIFYPPERGAFVSYFLGGIVPLVALGMLIEHYGLGPFFISGWFPEPGSDGILLLFFSISFLSMGSFLMLRRVVRDYLAKNHALAYYDSLTGLPNRRMYTKRLEQALVSARSRNEGVAVCYIDLDGFKRANDTLGHNVGDELLSQVAERLVGCVRMSDSVARLGPDEPGAAVSRFGGDEFTFLLGRISEPEQAGIVAERVLDVLRTPFAIGGYEVFISGSIGLAIFPTDGLDADTLLTHADMAMYWAKGRGRDNYQFFSQSMNANTQRKLQIEQRLRSAIERNELRLYFQPIRTASTGELAGAEALLRWNDSELGSVSPDEFIPVAEETGLITMIGAWVLRAACMQAQEWRNAGFRSIRMAVNVSGHQIRHPAFIETVAQVLRECEMSVAHLELEITESTIMQDDEVTSNAVRELQERGISLALDDFGTGYSSLSYLKRFPIRRVKIDRAFVAQLPNEPDDVSLTTAIVAMAHSLRKRVVAEGVETEEQAVFLRELECDELQGHLFSRAVPASEFVRFLEYEKHDRNA